MPHEVGLVQQTLVSDFLEQQSERLIGDRAYNSDILDAELKNRMSRSSLLIGEIAKAGKTDSRLLRRYKQHWKIERLFALPRTLVDYLLDTSEESKISLALRIYPSSEVISAIYEIAFYKVERIGRCKAGREFQ